MDWNESLFVEHRQSITKDEAKDAFDELVSQAVRQKDFTIKPAWHGQVRDFRYYDLASDEQPFAFTVNRGHLLFYIRKAGLNRVGGGFRALKHQFPSTSEVKSGEWTIRIETKAEAAHLNKVLFSSTSDQAQSAQGIPAGITRDDILNALKRLDAGETHGFSDSTKYDVQYKGRRYPPKAVVGLAASRLAGRNLEPGDFSGGVDSQCVRILKQHGFTVVAKRSSDSRFGVESKLEPGAGEKAKPMGGDIEYQRRARRALPVLVACAKAHRTISYKELARKLEMPNPRNLNYVLGSVGITLVHLSELWGEAIPPITTLVVRAGSTLPGTGADVFFSSEDGKSGSLGEGRQADVDNAIDSIFEYSEWDRVLQALNLLPHGAADAGLTAFLLSWNPDRFSWDSLPAEIERLHAGKEVRDRWSCGNRTDLPVGSRIFLVRLGQAPKGIVGRAESLSEPYEEEHWDPAKRDEGVKARYIDLRFTDLYEAPLVAWEELQQAPFSTFTWSIMASGVQLPPSIVGELDRRFDLKPVRATPTATSATSGPALGNHPYEKDIVEELAILNDENIPSTEKQQLIVARRGQGKFRENVLIHEPKCRVTKVQDARCLIASHIKPWSESTNAERLNGNNGLMLAPHVDRLFDQGLISFTDFGDLLVSPRCPTEALTAWGISPVCNVGPFRAAQRPFLAHHRKLHGFAG